MYRDSRRQHGMWGAPGGRWKRKNLSPKATNTLWAANRVFRWVWLLLIVYTCASAHAQGGVLGTESSGRPGASLPPLPEQLPGPPPGQILPPLPPPAEEPKLLPLTRVFVREIRIVGSTVFSAKELAEVIAPYVNRELSAEDLEELRLALTRYYVNRGYINSGAIIPDQTVVGGVITLQIIEGELTHIEVAGNRWFRSSYIRNRLALGAKPPLNINALQQRLQLLQQDERIQRLNAELRPGVQLGESVLHVRVEEYRPYKVWLTFNNYQSPTVGSERGLITVAHQNLTGHGDILRFQFGESSGTDLQIDASYALPLTVHDTTLTLRYRKNDTLVVEEPFEPLDIESESDIFEISLRQPVYRTLNREFTLEFSGEHLRSRTFLFGEPFSFSPGAKEGESTVTALRFSQEWLDRTQNQVIAVRSRFTGGVDALGATTNNSGIADGRFLAWLGQFQWVRRLGPHDIQFLFRTDLQLANDPLLPIEQIAVGGRFSVRGYRENQLVRDNGLIASLESRIPLIRNTRWADIVQLVPFVDVGRAWNTETPTPDPKTIASIGLGLRWEVTLTSPFPLKPQFEIYWGIPLKDIDTPGGNLQDAGVHLQFLLAAF